jgi:hypothetical protein
VDRLATEECGSNASRCSEKEITIARDEKGLEDVEEQGLSRSGLSHHSILSCCSAVVDEDINNLFI